ncbi:TELO2-interacting protein 2-like [Poecilia reticulata]|uniref:TELO2-interacting protein 2-like n=1 Tax=Poecilia reticulata TaxID=8081 RepID=UPI0004A480C5|nr:PREDICTED: TELO2-interacting protein 2-like [Poecilia reticulata]
MCSGGRGFMVCSGWAWPHAVVCSGWAWPHGVMCSGWAWLHGVMCSGWAWPHAVFRVGVASCCDVFRVGVAVCRHLRLLVPVLLGYLEVGDPPEESVRLKMLEVLQSTIRLAWPRMASRADALLRSLLRLLVDVSADPGLSDSVRLQLMEGSSASLRLLDAATQRRVQRLLLQVDSRHCSPQVLCCLATVTAEREHT